MINTKNFSILATFLVLSTLACKGNSGPETAAKSAESMVKPIDQRGKTANPADSIKKPSFGGVIKIDGSSTVFPISQAVAEEFQAKHKAKVTIGVSGTGGGFKKFCRGETAITGASRPIKQVERERCAAAGIGFIELPVAYDGIAVVVNKRNTWVDTLTTKELKTMWHPDSADKVTKWNQVRDTFPDKKFHLFGPGVDSGTFDYFTKAINGKEQASRGDFTASEDDNVLVHGVSSDLLALGFFGYAYYQENKDKLKLVPIDDQNETNGAGPIEPTLTTVANGTYQPLSRPIFIYVNAKQAEQPALQTFIQFYLAEATTLTKEVGYIPLPSQAYSLAQKRFTDRVLGSVFEGGAKLGVTVEDLLRGK